MHSIPASSWAKPVYLARFRTDEQGRLLVFGGRGKAASYDGSPAVTLPQRALVRRYVGRAGHGDREVPGSNTRSRSRLGGGCASELRTGAKIGPHNVDLMRDTAIKARKLPEPTRPSFQHRHSSNLRTALAAAMGQRRFCCGLWLGRPEQLRDR